LKNRNGTDREPILDFASETYGALLAYASQHIASARVAPVYVCQRLTLDFRNNEAEVTTIVTSACVYMLTVCECVSYTRINGRLWRN